LLGLAVLTVLAVPQVITLSIAWFRMRCQQASEIGHLQHWPE
jgi:hypothetical protein